MNGFHILVLAAVIVSAVFFVPRLVAIDRVFAEMDALDDEELAAILAEFPDYLTKRS
jgi:hypothetical protein